MFDLQRRDDAEASLRREVDGDPGGDAGEAAVRNAGVEVLELGREEDDVGVVEERVEADAVPLDGDEAAEVGDGQTGEADVDGVVEALLVEDDDIDDVGDDAEQTDGAADDD